jgi:hypothetical protein
MPNLPMDITATLTDFAPVPRKRLQHTGWMPERQKAFIQALAETGNATRAARMVNMSVVSAYQLRRAPGAEGFRKAWSAALDCGIERIRDLAFERAVEGELIPIFYRGDLMGYRRKHNTQLLMFILRHYGRDELGRRVTVNYFKTQAGASSGDGGAQASAEATTMVVSSTKSGRKDGEECVILPDDAGRIIDAFEGDELDPATLAALESQMALEGQELMASRRDWRPPEGTFIERRWKTPYYQGALEPPEDRGEDNIFQPGEPHWAEANQTLEPEAGPPTENAQTIASAETKG